MQCNALACQLEDSEDRRAREEGTRGKAKRQKRRGGRMQLAHPHICEVSWVLDIWDNHRFEAERVRCGGGDENNEINSNEDKHKHQDIPVLDHLKNEGNVS